MSEGVAAWRATAEYYSHLQGDGIFTRSTVTPGEPVPEPKRTAIAFKINGANQEILCKGLASGKEQVLGVNPKYEFNLLRQSDAGQYAIANVRQVASAGNRAFGMEDVINESFIHFLHAPWSIFGFSMDEIVKSEGFHMVKIENIARGREPLIRITFTYQPTSEGQKGFDAIVSLSPDSNWSILEYECATKSGGRMSGNVEYGDIQDGFRIPKKVSTRMEGKTADGPVKKMEFEFHRISPAEVPLSEFTLSAFGLPEFGDFQAKNPNRPWFLLLNIGIICLLVAAIIYRRVLKSHLRRVESGE